MMINLEIHYCLMSHSDKDYDFLCAKSGGNLKKICFIHSKIIKYQIGLFTIS